MVLVTGHRGAAGLEPENTLHSFKRAIDLGVDRIELDVHLTKDRKLVVIHDETVDRTTDGHGHVGGFTLEEIRGLDAGMGERVPTLQEVIDLAKGRVVMQIELKGLGVEGAVVRAAEENELGDDVVLTSFRHYMVRRAKTLNPLLSTGVIFLCMPINASRLALDAKADAIHPNVNYVDAHMVEYAHRHGLKVGVWTANDEGTMRRMVALGVDAIGSDRPDTLLNIVR